jgi:hypothetical protein
MASSTLASRTLIGSSNIYRFYNPETFNDHHPYLLTRCTRSSTLESNLLEVEAGSIVLISVLENFIQDAVVDSGVTESDAVADASTGKVVQEAIQKALVTINDAALRTIEDGNRFFVVEPINRIKPDWYSINLDNTISIFENQFEALCDAPNVWRIHASPTTEQKFIRDGVHLTEDSGKTFISTILRNVEASISSVNVASGPPDLSKPPPTSFQFAADSLRKRDATSNAESNTKRKRKFTDPWADDSQNNEEAVGGEAAVGNVVIPANILDRMLSEIKANKDGIEDLNNGFEKRKLEDNKSFAALREESDFIVNKSKLDRVVVFGLTSKTPLPVNKPERIQTLKALVMDQFVKIKPGFDGVITFISHLNFSGDRIPAVECRMNSVEKATEIRRECGRIRKANKSKAGQFVFITNCVTATTRVRIEILSKISMRLNERKSESYCITFEPRPILRVKHDRLGWKSFFYVEAIEKFSYVLRKEDMLGAYSKASIIREPIEQIFIILKEKEARGAAGTRMSWKGKAPSTGANAMKIPEPVKIGIPK